MDPRFLEYYDGELRHLGESCGEFAADFPKIAGRLGLEGFIKEFQCPDPYVERLLEGFAYMAARVQLKVDAEYPQFTQHLLEMVYPDYLAPTPSMGGSCAFSRTRARGRLSRESPCPQALA